MYNEEHVLMISVCHDHGRDPVSLSLQELERLGPSLREGRIKMCTWKARCDHNR